MTAETCTPSVVPSELWAHAGVAHTQLAMSTGAFLRLRVLGALPGEPLQNWGGSGSGLHPRQPKAATPAGRVKFKAEGKLC